ncbi:MAG: signal recognition particle-docking protein FtsY [Euryarchaeota archaeon]|nr:signal recognition particle-docking protein FtsY [Euryarchaeota archaeon]
METQRELERVVREGGVSARVRIPDEKLDDLLWELEMSLLESDVALPVTEAIKNNVREQLKEARVAKRDVHSLVERVLKTAIRNVLNEPFDFDGYVERADKPAVIMFVGVNGTGKTTAIAKIANRLKQNGKSVVLAAGDTFRAGAVQQLQQHADRLGVKMIKHEGKNADPAAVAFDAIDHAKSRNKDVVLIDTAGRMGTNVNLMDEMEKIKRVSQPDLIFFVGDSLAGNDAVSQADKFNDVVGIDGVILTKVDADAKGGAALSVAYAIGKPLVFIGLGQEYEDQVPFDRDWMVARLFSAEAEEAMAAA